MNKRTLLNLGKIQLCILTIVMIFCTINRIQLSSTFYTYYISALAFITFFSLIVPENNDNETHTPNIYIKEENMRGRKT